MHTYLVIALAVRALASSTVLVLVIYFGADVISRVRAAKSRVDRLAGEIALVAAVVFLALVLAAIWL